MKNVGTKILLITPPFTQLNTPYPATAYLKGFLNTKAISSEQCDLGIEVILQLFSSVGLKDLFDSIQTKNDEWSHNSKRMIHLQGEYIQTIDLVIAFLQDKNSSLAHLICQRNYLPEAARFEQLIDLEKAFGEMGIRDKARHLATLYLEDLGDLIAETTDAHFGFSRYAESLGRSAATFDEIDQSLKLPDSFIDRILLRILQSKIESVSPEIVALSIPFPGNLYAAFKCGQWLKANHPEITIVMGGGFPNTELRSLSDPRVFNYLDFITLDDGETPLINLIEHLDGKRGIDQLKRTFTCINGKVEFINDSTDKDIAFSETGTPDYSDFLLNEYLSVIEIVNPMHRLWSDGRWNKLTLSHGCYWGRCTFCDTSLDYIKRYDPATAAVLCDRIEQIIEQTGEIGFHFVDEAAPPALMRSLALEIIRRKITIVWWTNIRFEKSFSLDLCLLLRKSGCIAVSGGLEVASDRLLALINKGVSLGKVAQVTHHFTRAGILVHAYLMYGFPTQTTQETIDSLEVVRQLFEAGVIQSGFWHRFAMTAHSPVGLNPDRFHVTIKNQGIGTFANNDLDFNDSVGTDHELFGEGLRKSLFNYMNGIGIEFPLQFWFDQKIPRTKVVKDFIQKAIAEDDFVSPSPSSKVYWLGGEVDAHFFNKSKKGKTFEMSAISFFNKTKTIFIQLNQIEGKWLFEQIPYLYIGKEESITWGELGKSFEKQTKNDFILFWNSPTIKKIREQGLVVI